MAVSGGAAKTDFTVSTFRILRGTTSVEPLTDRDGEELDSLRGFDVCRRFFRYDPHAEMRIVDEVLRLAGYA